jgi:hypothetical protein
MYVSVSQAVSSLEAGRLKVCTHFSCPLISSIKLDFMLVKNTNYEAPHYVIFCFTPFSTQSYSSTYFHFRFLDRRKVDKNSQLHGGNNFRNLICSSFYFVIFVLLLSFPKYLNFATFAKDLLVI